MTGSEVAGSAAAGSAVVGVDAVDDPDAAELALPKGRGLEE